MGGQESIRPVELRQATPQEGDTVPPAMIGGLSGKRAPGGSDPLRKQRVHHRPAG